MNAIERIRAERLVVLLRKVPDAERLVETLTRVGVGVVEVTLDSPKADEVIARLHRRGDVTVLAGTVLTTDDVERAVAAGAEACVGPTFVPEVVERCLELEVAGNSRSLHAHRDRCRVEGWGGPRKALPAATLGPRYVRDLPRTARRRAPAGDRRNRRRERGGIHPGRCGRGRRRVGGHRSPTTRSRQRWVSLPLCVEPTREEGIRLTEVGQGSRFRTCLIV